MAALNRAINAGSIFCGAQAFLPIFVVSCHFRSCWTHCSAPPKSSHYSISFRAGTRRPQVVENLMKSFAVVPIAIQRRITRRACPKLMRLCCQTHSSFKLRKKRSTSPFCSGVYGVMSSCCSVGSRGRRGVSVGSGRRGRCRSEPPAVTTRGGRGQTGHRIARPPKACSKRPRMLEDRGYAKLNCSIRCPFAPDG